MTMKSVDPAHLRSVVLAGHAGGGKTTLAEQLLFRAGADPAARAGRRRHGPPRLRARGAEAQGVAEPRGRDFEHDGTRITLVDTPGYPDFVAEVVEGFAAADGALFVMDASGGVEAGLETAVALGRSTGRGGLLLPQQVRQGERRPDRGARRAARRVRQQDRPAPHRDRHGRALQRLRRPRPPQGVRSSRAARRSRSRSPTTSRARSRPAATSSSRRPPRPTTTS